MKNIIRKILLGTLITGLVVASPLSVRRIYAEDTRCNAAKTGTSGHSGHKYEIIGDTITVSTSDSTRVISNYCKFFSVIQNNTEIKKLVVSNSINEIGHEGGVGVNTGAFEECPGLEEVTIPSSVTKIGFNAFFGCTGLKRVNIEGTVTEIGLGAFSDCSSLTEITIKINGKIVDKAFDGCTNLNKVTISGNKIEIDEAIFTRCYNLKTVTLIPTGAVNIDPYIFHSSSIPTVIFGEGSERASVKSAISQLPASITEIVVPDTLYEQMIGDSELAGSKNKIKSQTTYNEEQQQNQSTPVESKTESTKEEQKTASEGTPTGPSKSIYDEKMDSLIKDINALMSSASSTSSDKNSADGKKTLYLKDVTSLSLSAMKALKSNPNVNLDMTYTYKGIAFHIVIPGGTAIYDESIPWYGPIWLYAKYGQGTLADVYNNNVNVYVVQSGDTLRKIAAKYGMTLDELIRKNPQIKNIDKISIGDKINL